MSRVPSGSEELLLKLTLKQRIDAFDVAFNFSSHYGQAVDTQINMFHAPPPPFFWSVPVEVHPPNSCCTVIIPSSCWKRFGKGRKTVVFQMLFLFDAGLIIVCLVLRMAVIETLAVRVCIQHVGGSCAPCGWILITSLDHNLKKFRSASFCLCCLPVLSLLSYFLQTHEHVSRVLEALLHPKQVSHWTLLTFPLQPRTHVVCTSQLCVDVIPTM